MHILMFSVEETSDECRNERRKEIADRSFRIQFVQEKTQVKKAVAFSPPSSRVHVTTDSHEAQMCLFYKREISCIHPEYEYRACNMTSIRQSQSD